MEIYSVPLTKLVKEFDLRVAYASSDYEKIHLTVEDVARPGLQLAGFFEHFEPVRLQVIGNVEASYLNKLSSFERSRIYDRLLSFKSPAMLIARDIEPDQQLMEMAKKHNITILRSNEATSTVVSAIIAYLKSLLAPRITRHAVLMEVYGEGVLITGESGIGKSEAAVELLKRGHRLIADDAVEIKKIAGNVLMGSAPDLIRNYVELRGIGVVNVAKLFGMGAVKETENINLVIQLEAWKKDKQYDRLGLEHETYELLGLNIPTVTIPVKPGRNLAVIIEVAAMNSRLKRLGYNAAEELNRRMEKNMGIGLLGN